MRVRLAVLALLSLLAAACFEDPVTETLVIQMAPGRNAVVTASVKFGTEGEGELLGKRIWELQRDFLADQDPWSRRFDRIGFEHEERTIVRDRAEKDSAKFRGAPLFVSSVKHTIVIPRSELAFLFSESGVTVSSAIAAGRADLLIVPGGGSLSTEEQRRVLRQHLRAWGESAVSYLSEARQMYRYLESAPDRATACFAWVFEDLVEKDTREANPLLDDEKEMVKRLKEAMEGMAKELTGMEELPYGLNELSYLVYDPLPAAVTVCLPREADLVEGFVASGDLCYTIPRRGIIEAFEALDGKWVAPDPFVTWIRVHRSQGNEKLDLAGFAAKPRAIAPLPDAATIIREMERGMRHEPAYRLEWIETEREE